MGAREADGGWPGARGVDVASTEEAMDSSRDMAGGFPGAQEVDGVSPETAAALERDADVFAARDFRALPEFRRLLVWLKANDGSGYGCIELNRAADVTAFIRQLREASGKRVAEVDYSRSGPDAELILPGQQYQTMERFREKYGNETLLVVTHLPESVDRFREEEVKSLVQEINMNRENYVYYPSQVLFAFSPWFMDRVYQAAYDFTSMLGFHADLTDWAGERQALSWEDPVAYRKRPGGRGRLELFWEDFANTGMPINRRMDAGKQYINICTYFFLHTDRELRRVGEILEMFDRVRDWNERIRNLDRETYRLPGQLAARDICRVGKCPAGAGVGG